VKRKREATSCTFDKPLCASKRIWRGRRDLEGLQRVPEVGKPREQRVRRPGGGRKPIEEGDPTLWSELEALVEPETRGDPESPHFAGRARARANSQTNSRRVGTRSAHERSRGCFASMTTACRARARPSKGSNIPIATPSSSTSTGRRKPFKRQGSPPSRSTREEGAGRVVRQRRARVAPPRGAAPRSPVHDFPNDAVGKAIPYGVYDVGRDEGWVSVGMDHDTSAFAVASRGHSISIRHSRTSIISVWSLSFPASRC
jgi:hypothetical protein